MHIAWRDRIIADSFQNVNLLDPAFMNRISPFVLALFLILTVAIAPGKAQEEEEVGPRLHLVRVDRSDFPTLGLHLIATDAQSRPLEDLQALRLRENGAPIADFTLDTAPAGIDVTFILDVLETAPAEEADEGEMAPEPLQLVRDSLLRFSGRYMESGRDRASLLVPAVTGGRWLVQDTTDPGELVDAINTYEPLSGQPQVLTMLGLALERMANQPEGDDLFRAIVLLTDGHRLNEFLFPPLVEQAQALQVPIFVLLVGPEPSQARRETLSQLVEPVRGVYVRLTDDDAADELYARLQANGVQQLLRYHSNLTTSGSYPLTVSLDGVRDEVTLDLELAPPAVSISLSQTAIRRAGVRPDAPLEELQPAVFSVPVEITWPDGTPRPLAGVTLRADGTPQTAPFVGSPDALTFEWDIAGLDEGTYDLTVQITDTVGLTARSAPVPVTVEVARPEPSPTPTPVPAASQRFLDALQTRLAEVDVILLPLGVFAVLIVLALVVRSLLRRSQAVPSPSSAPATVEEEDEEDQPPPAGENADAPPAALLEVEGPLEVEDPLKEGDDTPYEGRVIPLQEDNVTIGRDTRAAQIALPDATVSRFHARIRWRNGAYWLYDEGSERGTYLNFERLGLAPRRLHDGDEIQIGRVRLRFRLRPD